MIDKIVTVVKHWQILREWIFFLFFFALSLKRSLKKVLREKTERKVEINLAEPLESLALLFLKGKS